MKKAFKPVVEFVRLDNDVIVTSGGCFAHDCDCVCPAVTCDPVYVEKDCTCVEDTSW